MKKLIICWTYYQLIIAIQLKLTLFKNDKVSILFADHSVNCDKVTARLKKLKIFANVEIIHMKHHRQIFKDIAMVLEYNFGKKNKLNIDLYDEVIYHSNDLLIYAIADVCAAQSQKVIWSRMEEGLFSYDSDFAMGNKVKITRQIRKITKRTDVFDEIKNYYCFFPECKDNPANWNLIKIPPITEEIDRLREILNYIFEYEPQEYKQKYIFFTSCFDIDGRDFGETELVLKVAEKVGIKNLLVKMHPRDNRKIYEEHGIHVMRNSYVPWEVIQLNWEKNPHILLTANSGAFISITSLLKKDITGYFLYSYIDNKNESFLSYENKISLMLNKLHSLNIANNIIALNRIDK